MADVKLRDPLVQMSIFIFINFAGVNSDIIIIHSSRWVFGFPSFTLPDLNVQKILDVSYMAMYLVGNKNKFFRMTPEGTIATVSLLTIFQCYYFSICWPSYIFINIIFPLTFQAKFKNVWQIMRLEELKKKFAKKVDLYNINNCVLNSWII